MSYFTGYVTNVYNMIIAVHVMLSFPSDFMYFNRIMVYIQLILVILKFTVLGIK